MSKKVEFLECYQALQALFARKHVAGKGIVRAGYVNKNEKQGQGIVRASYDSKMDF